MNDTNFPNAIFIEYIPGMRQLYLDTFTEQRMDRALFTGIIKMAHGCNNSNNYTSKQLLIHPLKPAIHLS